MQSIQAKRLARRWVPAVVVGLALVATQAQGQLISLPKPRVPVTFHHAAGMKIALQGKKVALGQISGPCAQQFSDSLVSAFQMHGVEIVNREYLNTILTEHRFQASSSVDPATAVQLGRILGPSVMVFVRVSRCGVERKSTYEDQFIGPRVNVSTSQAHFLASVDTVDLATGADLAVRSIEANPKKENRSTTGVPEFPGEVEVQDQAVHEAVTKAEHLYFPWTETAQVVFMNSKECNLKQAYDLLKAGDNEGALKAAKDSVDVCKSQKPNRQADAWYNLGMSYALLDKYDDALAAMAEANKLHSDKIVVEAIAGIRQEQANEAAIARSDAEQSAEAKHAQDDQARRAQEVAKAALTNDSIIKMIKGGLSADVVVRMIASQPCKFSVTPDDLLALKQAGVPDSVIAAMLDKK